jgi:hypothetical protein
VKKLTIAFLLGASFALASPAIADQVQVGYPGAPFGPYQSGVGGEFTLNDINTEGWLDLSGYVAGKTSNFGGITSFQTFCIEKTEFIYNTIYDAKLNTRALYGSEGPAGDPISAGTGWLYSQFAQGVLSGYAYSGTEAARETSADLLQKALWWLEGEDVFNAGNIYMAAVVANFGSQANAQADGGAIYGVSALNLWLPGTNTAVATNRAQDQLFYKRVPDGGQTLALLGMALCGMTIASRRFRRA